MPTKLISRTLLGALSATVMAAPAFAGGNCNGGNCAGTVQMMPGYAPEFGPMTIRTQQPMGHLRSVNFQRSPNVSITRIHGMAPTAGLSDAPSGFTGGCHPTSTTYCRQDAGRPVQVEFNRPAPAPIPLALYSPPAPVVQAPAEPRTVRIGGGYDPSKFAPRTYGDASLVPGIAYVPTSKVVRDPAAAQQVLDSGLTRPQDVVVPGRSTAPNMNMVAPQAAYGGVNLPGTFSPQAAYGGVNLPGTFSPRSSSYSVNLPGTFQPRAFVGGQSAPAPQMAYGMSMPTQQMRAPGLMNTQGLSLAPTRRGPSYGQPSAPVLQQSGPMAGSYGSSVAGDGSYWEKVSGPTAFGSTIATSVICKRQLPKQTVNPVVGVPVPVPVPVHQECRTAQAPAGRYGHSAPGRWIH